MFDENEFFSVLSKKKKEKQENDDRVYHSVYDAIVRKELQSGGAQRLYDALKEYDDLSRSYVTTAYDRFGGRKENEAPSYNGASAQWLSESGNDVGRIGSAAKEVNRLMDRYGDYLDDDFKKNTHLYMASMSSGVREASSAYEREHNYFGRFLDENDYKNSLNAFDPYSFDIAAGEKELEEKKQKMTALGGADNSPEFYSKYSDRISQYYADKGYDQDEIGRRLETIRSGDAPIEDVSFLRGLRDESNAERKALSKDISDLATRLFKAQNAQKALNIEKDLATMPGYDTFKVTNTGDRVETKWGLENFSFVTDNERKAYFYLRENMGEDAAQEYLDAKREELNQREGQHIYEGMQGNSFLEVLWGAVAGFDQFGRGVRGAFNFSGDYEPASSVQYANQYAVEDMESRNETKFLGRSLPTWLNEALSTTMNMVPSIALSAAVGPAGLGFSAGAATIAGSALMGLTSGGNAYQEAINSGYDQGSAYVYGALTGLSETMLQSALGSIAGKAGFWTEKGQTAVLNKLENVFKNVVSQPGIKGALGKFGYGAARLGVKFGTEAFGEGLEESLQEILEPVMKMAIFGEENKIDWQDVAYSGLMGGLTSVLMGAPTIIGEEVSSTRIGNRALANGETLKNLVGAVQAEALANGLKSADNFAVQIAEEIAKGASAVRIGEFLREAGGYVSEQNAQALEKAYNDLGITGDAAKNKVAWIYQATSRGVINDENIAMLEEDPTNSAAIYDALVKNHATTIELDRAYDNAMRDIFAERVIKTGMKRGAYQDRLNEVKREERAQRKQTYAEMTDARAAGRDFAPPSETQNPGGSINDRIGVTGSFRVGDNGVNRVKFVNNGKVEVNGQQVDPSTVTYKDRRTADMVEALSHSKYTDNERNAIMAADDGKASVQASILAAQEAYEYGRVGVEYDSIKNPVFMNENATLSKMAHKLAFDAQREQAQSEQDALKKKIYEATVSAEGSVIDATNKGVHPDELPEKQKAAYDFIKQFSALSGTTWVLYHSGEKASMKNRNGAYLDGVFYIDMDAGIDKAISGTEKTEGLMAYTISHELTHFIEDWSPVEYRKLQEFLLSNFAAKDMYDELGRPMSVESMIREQQNAARAEGVDLSRQQAIDEIIANSAESFLTDSGAIEKLAELKRNDKKLYEKVKGKLKKIADRMTAAYADLDPTSREAKIFARYVDDAKKAYDLWSGGLVDASKSYSQGGTTYSNRKGTKMTPELMENMKTVMKGEGKDQIKAESEELEALRKNAKTASEEWNDLREKRKEIEFSDEYEAWIKRLADDLSKENIAAYEKWEEDNGILELFEREKELRVKYLTAQKEYSDALKQATEDEEKKAIKESGLSEGDYYRKKAVMEFGYTPYFTDAGYILPNGRMLNFSGEKGKHYGTRGEDHRAIGTVYTDVSGSDAMVRFMGEGNIRIMAETPGIDISAAAAPTREQYSTIERFVNNSKKDGYFSVDFTDENGNTVGNLEYEGSFSSVRVMNDIKRFFETGELNKQSELQKFRYQLKESADADIRKAISDKFYRDEVVLTEHSPRILIGQKGVKDLPMVIKPSHIRTTILTEAEAKALGITIDKNDHYHGLGVEFFESVIDGLDEVTLAYRGTKKASAPERRENYFLLVSKKTDADGNPIIVPVYVNSKGKYNEVIADVNKIATVFGKESLNDYLTRLVKEGDLVRVKVKGIEASDRSGLIPAGYSNNASYDGSIAQLDEIVNTQTEKTPKKSGEVKSQLKTAVTQQMDEEYMALAKEPEKNEAELQKMVNPLFDKYAKEHSVTATEAANIFARIAQKYDEDNYAEYGIRGDDRLLVPENVFPNSHSLYVDQDRVEPIGEDENGDPIYEMFEYAPYLYDGGELSGTSTVGVEKLTKEEIERAIKNVVKKYVLENGYVYLVAGDDSTVGEDPGEQIIENAKVLSVLCVTGKTMGDTYRFVNKSSAPVTYDDNGNVIPLSERFDPNKTDIRWQRKTGDTAIADYLNMQSAEIEQALSGEKEETYSPRLALTGALEKLAWSEKDRDLLEGYRAKISKYNEMEKELADVKKELKKIDFNNPEERALYFHLRDKKIELTNKLQTYDRQLLRLEGAGPFREMVQRTRELTRAKTKERAWDEYNKRLKKVQDEAFDSKQAAIEKERQKKYDALERQKEHQKEVAEKKKERMTKTKVRKNILKLTESISARITDPKKSKYVPTEYLQSVVKFLDMVNLDTVEADARIAEMENELAWTEDEIAADVLRKRIEDLKRIDENATKKREERAASVKAEVDRNGVLREMVRNLREDYKDLSGNRDLANNYAEYVDKELDGLAKTIGNTSIRNMSLYQLQETERVITMLDYYIKNAVELIGENEKQNAIAFGEKLIKELREDAKQTEHPMLARIRDMQLRPSEFFDRLAGYAKGSNWSKLYDMLDRGQREQLMLQMKYESIFADLLNKSEYQKDYKALKEKVKIGLRDEDGKDVEVSRGIAIAIYMTLLNEDGAKHIMRGGMEIPDVDLYYKKKKEAYSKTVRVEGSLGELVDLSAEQRKMIDRVEELSTARSGFDSERSEQIRSEGIDKIDAELKRIGKRSAEVAERMSELKTKEINRIDELRNAIKAQLTPYEQQLIEKIQKLYKETATDLNATTLLAYGVTKANVDNYFRINVSKNFLDANFESIKMDQSLENAGFMKERVFSQKPIIIEDVLDVVGRSIEDTARYAGMLIPLMNFNKVFNVQQSAYSDSVQKAVNEVTLGTGTKYIENLLKQLNGAKSKAGILSAIRSNAAGAALTLNPSVTFGQAASYPAAAAVVGYKPLLKALREGVHRADIDLINKYTALLWYRKKGYRDTETADIVSGEGPISKVLNSSKGRFLFKWIQGMDVATVGRLWSAAEYYVQDKNADLKKGSEDYYKQTAKVFSEIVEKTQPDYTTLQRPEILRTDSELIKSMTMFMTQRLQNFNILYGAAQRYQKYRKDFVNNGRNGVTAADVKSAKTDLIRAVSSQLVSAAVLVAMKQLVRLALHKNDDWIDEETGDVDPGEAALSFADGMLDTIFGTVIGGSELYELARSVATGKKYYGIDVNGVSQVGDIASKIVQFVQNPGLQKAKNAAYAVGTALGIPARNAENILMAVPRWIQGWQNTKAQDMGKIKKAMIAGDAKTLEKMQEKYGAEDLWSLEKSIVREDSAEVKAEARAYLETGDIRTAWASKYHLTKKDAERIIEAEASYLTGRIDAAANAKADENEDEYEKIVGKITDRYAGVYGQEEIDAMIDGRAAEISENAEAKAMRESSETKNAAKEYLSTGKYNTAALRKAYGLSAEDAEALVKKESTYLTGRITAAAKARIKKDDAAYKKVVRTLLDRYEGVYTQDDIIRLINARINELSTKK